MEESMRNRPEQSEETADPTNPPQRTAGAAMVAGLWYFLAPLGIILLLIVLAFFYWGDSARTVDEPIEPTTGISEEVTPGGGEPDRGYGTAEQEREHRGN
ncbi:MAG: hypothetical protein A3F70_16515 [Acidobacteria bacterium RIFCSPLOWO2_12_FULL_67_14]|nr:MAG: hypothetical protein A3H29_19745 [Acidobacteria bacterium RIFCSPLOWO2_02_FULL_67_21]OFW40798.1 MAG: hypothetical protein A3F70_16515 [Acidobacteria bacterium RIFCSPLOWO2_12_FULL_67_14]